MQITERVYPTGMEDARQSGAVVFVSYDIPASRMAGAVLQGAAMILVPDVVLRLRSLYFSLP
jgi:hypothetical protein